MIQEPINIVTDWMITFGISLGSSLIAYFVGVRVTIAHYERFIEEVIDEHNLDQTDSLQEPRSN